MIKSVKKCGEGEENRHSWNCLPLPHGESFPFIFEFLFDLRKDNLMILAIKSLFPYHRLILPYQGLIFLEVRDLETRKSVDKYLLHNFHLNVFIHNELSKCSRMVGWGTRDPIWDLRLSRLVSSHMVLIRRASLGRFMMWARLWASVGAKLIE